MFEARCGICPPSAGPVDLFREYLVGSEIRHRSKISALRSHYEVFSILRFQLGFFSPLVKDLAEEDGDVFGDFNALPVYKNRCVGN